MAKTALFIDFDNIQIEASKIGLEHCSSSQLWSAPLISEIESSTMGTVDIRKCYGNVMLNTNHVFIERIYNSKNIRSLIDTDINLQYDLIKNGFQMIHTPGLGHSGKNRADILMALDCIEIALKHDKITHIAIFTQDSDFSPLFHKIRALGKKIILITVSDFKKRSKGIQVLLSLVNEHIVYNQDVIDKFGYNILKKVLLKVEKEEPEAFDEGLNLSAIYTQILDQESSFNHENIGFTKFKDFVETCLQDKYKIESNLIKINKNYKSDTEIHIKEDNKITKIISELRKQKLRINFPLIFEIHEYISKESFFKSEKEILHGEMKEKIINEFYSEDYSKSQIQDALKILSLIKFIAINNHENVPFNQKNVKIYFDIDINQSIANEMITRIVDSGFNITSNDIEKITELIFLKDSDQFKKNVKNALETIKLRNGE